MQLRSLLVHAVHIHIKLSAYISKEKGYQVMDVLGEVCDIAISCQSEGPIEQLTSRRWSLITLWSENGGLLPCLENYS